MPLGSSCILQQRLRVRRIPDALEETKKRQEETAKAAYWDEYIRLSDTVSRLRKEENAILLRTIAIRVREIEGHLGLTETSIVADIK